MWFVVAGSCWTGNSRRLDMSNMQDDGQKSNGVVVWSDRQRTQILQRTLRGRRWFGNLGGMQWMSTKIPFVLCLPRWNTKWLLPEQDMFLLPEVRLSTVSKLIKTSQAETEMEGCCLYCCDTKGKDPDFKDSVFIPRISSTVNCVGCRSRRRLLLQPDADGPSGRRVVNKLNMTSAGCAAMRTCLHEQAGSLKSEHGPDSQCEKDISVSNSLSSSALVTCNCHTRISGFQKIDKLFELAMSPKMKVLYSSFWCRIVKLMSWLNGAKVVRFPNNNAAVRVKLVHSICEGHGVQATFGIERPSQRNGKLVWQSPVWYDFRTMSEKCHLWRIDDSFFRDLCENFIKPLDKRHSHNDPCCGSNDLFVIERAPYLTNANKTLDRGNSYYETRRSKRINTS